MAEPAAVPGRTITGYGFGSTDVVLSVDEVEHAAGELAMHGQALAELGALAGGEPLVAIDELVAGYGNM